MLMEVVAKYFKVLSLNLSGDNSREALPPGPNSGPPKYETVMVPTHPPNLMHVRINGWLLVTKFYVHIGIISARTLFLKSDFLGCEQTLILLRCLITELHNLHFCLPCVHSLIKIPKLI